MTTSRLSRQNGGEVIQPRLEHKEPKIHKGLERKKYSTVVNITFVHRIFGTDQRQCWVSTATRTIMTRTLFIIPNISKPTFFRPSYCVAVVLHLLMADGQMGYLLMDVSQHTSYQESSKLAGSQKISNKNEPSQ